MTSCQVNLPNQTALKTWAKTNTIETSGEYLIVRKDNLYCYFGYQGTNLVLLMTSLAKII